MAVRRFYCRADQTRYQDQPGTHLMHLETMRYALYKESLHS
jgi:hypothetical protein